MRGGREARGSREGEWDKRHERERGGSKEDESGLGKRSSRMRAPQLTFLLPPSSVLIPWLNRRYGLFL